MASTPTYPWITCPRPNPRARLRLFAVPYAGSGASVFRSWLEKLPPDVELRPVQLPGRENRLMEPPLSHVSTVVGPLAPLCASLADLPFAVFGHSMGALVAFELVRELRRQSGLLPMHLFVAAHRAPQAPNPEALMYDLPDEEFIAEVCRRYDSIPVEVRENTELMDLMLPALRADISICDTYAHREEEALACPVTAFGGLEDPCAPPEQLEGWRHQTSGAFRRVMFPGGHFFLQASQGPLLDEMARDLARGGGGGR